MTALQIGNAVINEATDMAGLVDYAWSHAIISDEVHTNIHGSCRFEEETTNKSEQCYDNFKGFMDAYSDIDIYSIYTPVCLSSSSSSSSRKPKIVVSPRLLTSQVRYIHYLKLFVMLCNHYNFFSNLMWFDGLHGSGLVGHVASRVRSMH